MVSDRFYTIRTVARRGEESRSAFNPIPDISQKRSERKGSLQRSENRPAPTSGGPRKTLLGIFSFNFCAVKGREEGERERISEGEAELEGGSFLTY